MPAPPYCQLYTGICRQLVVRGVLAVPSSVLGKTFCSIQNFIRPLDSVGCRARTLYLTPNVDSSPVYSLPLTTHYHYSLNDVTITLVGSYNPTIPRFFADRLPGWLVRLCRLNALGVKIFHTYQRCPVECLGLGSAIVRIVCSVEASIPTRIDTRRVVFIPVVLVVLCSLRPHCPVTPTAPGGNDHNAPSTLQLSSLCSTQYNESYE
jgi:hypothetical protein